MTLDILGNLIGATVEALRRGVSAELLRERFATVYRRDIGDRYLDAAWDVAIARAGEERTPPTRAATLTNTALRSGVAVWVDGREYVLTQTAEGVYLTGTYGELDDYYPTVETALAALAALTDIDTGTRAAA